MPPLEQFIEVCFEERRELFYRNVEHGDVVIGRINSVRDFALFVTLLCAAGELERDIEDQEIKMGALNVLQISEWCLLPCRMKNKRKRSTFSSTSSDTSSTSRDDDSSTSRKKSKKRKHKRRRSSHGSKKHKQRVSSCSDKTAKSGFPLLLTPLLPTSTRKNP